MIFKDSKVYDILKLIALLALPIGTVKSRIFFTRQRLQKELVLLYRLDEVHIRKA